MARSLCPARHYPDPLLAVAAYGLGGSGRRLPSEPLDGPDFSRLLTAARENRVSGQLHAALEDGGLPASREQRARAATSHRTRTLRMLALDSELVTITELLAEAGVTSRVLKGPAVASLDYRRPGLRSHIDLDVLVRPADIDTAVARLGGAGLVRTLAQPRPGFDRRFDKGVTLRSGAGYELDLHRTFVLGPWGRRVDTDDLFDGGAAFTVGGRTLRALSFPNRFLHACYHATLGNWPLRLGSLRDVAEMLPTAERHCRDISVRMTDWRVEALVAAAVQDTRRLLGLGHGGELSEWAARFRPSTRDERWIGLHTRTDKTFTAQALATVPVIAGTRNKLAYLRALALPDPAYTAGRHASAAHRFGYAVRQVRRGRSGTDPGSGPVGHLAALGGQAEQGGADEQDVQAERCLDHDTEGSRE